MGKEERIAKAKGKDQKTNGNRKMAKLKGKKQRYMMELSPLSGT
jgi:hypothetical protein